VKKHLKVALVGNPNTGKSTLFNLLTGLNQKIANFPGVTVDKKTGTYKLPTGQEAQLIDLPGAYSLYPKSKDEAMLLEVLADTKNEIYPDVVVFIADATNLKRNLLLFSQVADLKLPTIIALNMMDLAKRGGVHIQIDKLAQKLGVRVVPISARNSDGIDTLKLAISETSSLATQTDTIDFSEFLNPVALQELQTELGVKEPYEAVLLAHQYGQTSFLSTKQKEYIGAWVTAHGFKSQDLQAKETIARYNAINEVLFDTVKTDIQPLGESYSNRIDRVLTHKFWGLGIFMLILFTIFQSIFSWSAYPMSLIEDAFVWLGNTAHQLLPPHRRCFCVAR